LTFNIGKTDDRGRRCQRMQAVARPVGGEATVRSKFKIFLSRTVAWLRLNRQRTRYSSASPSMTERLAARRAGRTMRTAATATAAGR
jgi:hypothetical protein